jgi:hypothetical protein
MLDVLVQQIVGVGQREQAAVELRDFGAVAAEGLGGHRLDDRHRVLEPMRHFTREQLLVLGFAQGQLKRHGLAPLLGEAIHLRRRENRAGDGEVAEQEIDAAPVDAPGAARLQQIIRSEDPADDHRGRAANEAGSHGHHANRDDDAGERQDVRRER